MQERSYTLLAETHLRLNKVSTSKTAENRNCFEEVPAQVDICMVFGLRHKSEMRCNLRVLSRHAVMRKICFRELPFVPKATYQSSTLPGN